MEKVELLLLLVHSGFKQGWKELRTVFRGPLGNLRESPILAYVRTSSHLATGLAKTFVWVFHNI